MGRSTQATSAGDQKKYVGVRRRKWGKWVSEIRVPATRARVWLGSYSNPEAAAVAHDTAVFCLHGPPSIRDLNFPSCVPASAQMNMSPNSIQRVATAAGSDMDAKLILSEHFPSSSGLTESSFPSNEHDTTKHSTDDRATPSATESEARSVQVPNEEEFQEPGSWVCMDDDDKGPNLSGGEAWNLFMADRYMHFHHFQ